MIEGRALLARKDKTPFLGGGQPPFAKLLVNAMPISLCCSASIGRCFGTPRYSVI